MEFSTTSAFVLINTSYVIYPNLISDCQQIIFIQFISCIDFHNLSLPLTSTCIINDNIYLIVSLITLYIYDDIN